MQECLCVIIDWICNSDCLLMKIVHLLADTGARFTENLRTNLGKT